MKKSKICVSRRLLFIFVLVMSFITLVILANKLSIINTSLFSKAAIRRTPTTTVKKNYRQAKQPTVMTVKSIMDTCQLSSYKLPTIGINNRDNKYAIYISMMVNWFVKDNVARINGNYTKLITDMNGDIKNPCGLWGNTMKRLLENYNNNIDPEIALNDIRLLSAGILYQKKLGLGNDYFNYYKSNSNNVESKVPGCLRYYSKSFTNNCLSIDTVLKRFPQTSSYIYTQAEEKPVPIILYSIQELKGNPPQWANAIANKYSINPDDIQYGVFYVNPSTAIEALIMPYVSKEVGVQVNNYCKNSLSTNSSLCNIDLSKITDPSYISKIIVESQFGRGNLNSEVVQITDTMMISYSTINTLYGLVSSTNEVVIGYDYQSLPLPKQYELTNNLIAQAHRNRGKAILEIGPGPKYTPQTESPNNVVITWDLQDYATDIMLNKPRIFNVSVGNLSPTYWFKGNVQSIQLDNGNRFDEVFMTCPFPQDVSSPDSLHGEISNITNITRDVLTTKLSQSKDARMVIILDPIFNSPASGYEAFSNTNTINKLRSMFDNNYTIEQYQFKDLYSQNKHSYFRNLQSDFIMDNSTSEAPVIIFTKK